MLIGFLLAALAAAAPAADGLWSRFRGPNGAGVVDTAPIPTDFGPDLNVVWKTPLPPGHSSPVLSRDRVYVTALDGNQLLTIALARDSGKELWRSGIERPAAALPVDKRNHPASPTPAVDERDNVYVFFQDFGLLAYDRQGKERWRIPLGPFNNAYGMASSPIVSGDTVVLVCDQSTDSFMMAVDRSSGKIRWKVSRPESKTGHSTPILYQPKGGAMQLLVPGSFYLTAYSLATGEKIWWVKGLAFEMKATPVIQDDVVFIHGTSTSNFEDGYGGKVPSFAELKDKYDTDGDGRFSRDEVPDPLAKKWMKLMDLNSSGYLDPEEWAYFQAARSSRGGMWAYRLGGKGDMTEASTLWHYDRSVPQLPSPLVYRGVLYMVNDGGIMTALDPASGKSLAQARLRGAVDNYYASPVAADGKLLVVSESGKVAVLKADGALSMLTVNDLDDLCYATPAIADGRVYIRTRGMMYAFGVQAATQ
jgi:outer membrane protein assembly factor BamB